jgi:hypothetical protein
MLRAKSFWWSSPLIVVLVGCSSASEDPGTADHVVARQDVPSAAPAAPAALDAATGAPPGSPANPGSKEPTAAEAAADRANAKCTQFSKCMPDVFAGSYLDLASCIAMNTSIYASKLAAPGSSGTPRTFSDCASAIRAASCADAPYDEGMPACRSAAGALPSNAACLYGEQCQGGACAKSAACGTCTTLKPSGASCSGSREECDAGLYCIDARCQAYVPSGGACSGPNLICDGGMACVAGVCTSRVGAGCSRHSDCPWPLFCSESSSTCQPMAWVNPGDACGYVGGDRSVWRGCRGACAFPNDDAMQGVCAAMPGAGGACDDANPCNSDSACDAGKCVLVATAVCK